MKQKSNRRRTGIGIGLIVILLLALSGAAMLSASLSGDLPGRPPTVTPYNMGPRPTPTVPSAPTSSPDSQVKQKEVVTGGFIELAVSGKPGLWTQVQWLAGDGNWYDVDGWGGYTLADRPLRWYVGEGHLGAKAWFRWRVYDREGGELLATSDRFKLPAAARQTTAVSVLTNR